MRSMSPTRVDARFVDVLDDDDADDDARAVKMRRAIVRAITRADGDDASRSEVWRPRAREVARRATLSVGSHDWKIFIAERRAGGRAARRANEGRLSQRKTGDDEKRLRRCITRMRAIVRRRRRSCVEILDDLRSGDTGACQWAVSLRAVGVIECDD